MTTKQATALFNSWWSLFIYLTHDDHQSSTEPLMRTEQVPGSLVPFKVLQKPYRKSFLERTTADAWYSTIGSSFCWIKSLFLDKLPTATLRIKRISCPFTPKQIFFSLSSLGELIWPESKTNLSRKGTQAGEPMKIDTGGETGGSRRLKGSWTQSLSRIEYSFYSFFPTDNFVSLQCKRTKHAERRWTSCGRRDLTRHKEELPPSSFYKIGY